MPMAIDQRFHAGYGQRYVPEITDARGNVIHNRDIARDGEGVRRTFAMMDRGLTGGAAPDDASAGRAAAQELLRKEAARQNDQPPPPRPLSDAERTLSCIGVNRALADRARIGMTDGQKAHAEYAAYLSGAWGDNASQRQAYQASGMRSYVGNVAHDSAHQMERLSDRQAGHQAGDRIAARDEMVRHLNDAWKGAA